MRAYRAQIVVTKFKVEPLPYGGVEVRSLTSRRSLSAL
jgi:hypothetical protein